MDQDEKFQKEIAPFFWVDHTESASVCLTVGEFLQDLFDTRQADGFDGGGYDWASLAKVFIDETCPELASKIYFDPESSMFCAYSKDKDALAEFILQFRRACTNRSLITDLFQRAEPD